MMRNAERGLKYAVRILENLSRELNRLPSSDECIARLRASPEFAHIGALHLKAFVDKWARVRAQHDSKRVAQHQKRLRQQQTRLHARLKALLRKPRGHFRQVLTDLVRRSDGIDDLVARVSRTPEFHQLTAQQLDMLARKELALLLQKEENRARRRKQIKKAEQILDGFSQELNSTPSVDECLARMRECSEFADIGVGQLKALVQRGARARRRKWIGRAGSVIESLSKELNRTPSVDECVARLRGSSEFAHIEAVQLERLVVQATQARARRKARQEARAKRQQQAKGGDAMDRAVLGGFETNRRRH